MQPAPKSAFKELRPKLTPRPPSIVVTRDVLRVEDGDDLVRSRIDDEDLVADQDVVVASPLRIDHEHFRRQRIETHALRHPGSHPHDEMECEWGKGEIRKWLPVTVPYCITLFWHEARDQILAGTDE
jgi:hypothetical protein